MKQLAILMCSALLFFSCSKKDEEETNTTPELTIEYGTYFGFCYGYCSQSVSIKNETATYRQAVNQNFADSSNYPAIIISEPYTDYDELINKIDVDAFFALDEIYGCPDCTDGGVEWMKITKADGTSHEIKYDPGQNPEALDAYIDYVKTPLISFIEDQRVNK